MITSPFKQLRAAIGFTLLATSTLTATDFVVSNNADIGAGSLRQAILDANAGGGGDIVFPSLTGTIHLASPLPTITANVNIKGPGINLLTVSGNNQCVMFSASAGTTTFLANFVIADAKAVSTTVPHGMGSIQRDFPGTAISNAGAMTLQNCVITNCVNDGLGRPANTPGPIYTTGSLSMQNCLITGCGATYFDSGTVGGCIYSLGFLSLNNCCLTNCRAARATGIYSQGTAVLQNCLLTHLYDSDGEGNGGALVVGGSTTILSCMISNCSGGWEGGAILGNNIFASNSVFVANSAGVIGGGFYIGGSNFFYGCTIANCGTSLSAGGLNGGGGVLNAGNTTFVNCTISGNAAPNFAQGGGIYNFGTINMTNCTISGNSSVQSIGGGILNVSNAIVNLTDCTITSNTIASGSGGGILNQPGGTVNVQNTIIANNSSNDVTGILTSAGYNLIGNTNTCVFAGDVTGNIYGANPLLGPLQLNGGMTKTHALLAGSPAIDAGPTNANPYVDQRGAPRPQGAADDIGAFEYAAVPPAINLTTVPANNGSLNINFIGAPGTNYTVLRASSPAGPWASVAIGCPGSDGCGACLDVNPPLGHAYYRVSYP